MATPSFHSKTRNDVILARRWIEGLIADGGQIIIVDGKVLKVDAWLKFHPGGDKPILHMVGRDATDEINALHSSEARQMMLRYQIGIVNGRWTNFLPPIQGGQFREWDGNAQMGDAELEEEIDPRSGSESSASSTSRNSPVFEPADRSLGLYHRKREDTVDDDSSSISSVSTIDLASALKEPKLAHLDVYTQEEIDLDLAKYPLLDEATQDKIVRRYRGLREQLEAEGLFQCNYRSYAIEASRYLFLFTVFLFALRWGWYMTSGLFLGMLWHQLTFTVHDAGHMGITHNFVVDSIIGIVLADFVGGLSLGWWKRSHNVHHIVTNSPEHDPDIEHMPFFAISHRFFHSLRSTYYDRIMTYDSVTKFTIRYQNYLYYPILLFGRFNLYRLSWVYLVLGQGPRRGQAWWHRWLEIAGQIFFWIWFGYGIVYRSIPTTGARVAFVMISHMVTAPLHVQITLSHFAMSTADLGVNESFPQKMLRTTMDVDCPEWLDFFHGGLQFQAIHHLFPRMPRHNLRRTQKLVQTFCRDVGIPYALYGFVDGNKQVIGKLGEVGRQAAILAQCQKSMAEKSGLH